MRSRPGSPLHAAVADFREARQRAAVQELLARLRGRSVDLLSYHDVAHKLRAVGMSERGLRDIPIDAIAGSVGRYHDFTRSFLPRKDSDQERWARLRAAITDHDVSAMAPIDVYQIGDVYFVQDGNHRVSIARQLGMTHILAAVTEVRTRVPLAPDTRPDELILKAEYVEFLETTRLDRLRPDADLTVSVPGQYAHLENHIEAHRYLREEARAREMEWDEAVGDWYDSAYLPLVLVIREQGILRDFPGRTEADLYVWLTEHWSALRDALGWDVRPEVAASRLVEESGARLPLRLARTRQRVLEAVVPASLQDGPPPGLWRRERLVARYSARLFMDVLVPVDGGEIGWRALEQALAIARREDGQVLGLHVTPAAGRAGDIAAAVAAEFDRRCSESGVAGRLAVEAGSISERICARAVLADLVVVGLAHPPGSTAREKLESGFRRLIQRCARPVLAVPGAAAPLARVLLAYDGSPKAREALFVAAYMGDVWRAAVVVASVAAGAREAAPADYARRYLEMHEVEAAFLETAGPVPDALLAAAEAHAADLVLMGGYGAGPLRGVFVGSTVDAVLRASTRPVLVCR